MFTDNPDFYPTPAKVALKMLARVSKDAVNFLEPSAGKGDLADIIKRKGQDRWERSNKYRIDVIEPEPDLLSALRGKDYTIVGNDWLNYSGVSYYDAILMNPPFSNGDEHLLKAWEFMWDGEIVCLFNEETIKNPHTTTRRRLAEIIRDHGDVEFLGDCFKSAQHKTSVNVAMVYLRKKSDTEDLHDLWAKDGQEKPADDSAGADAIETMLAVPDMLGNLEHYYNMSNEHMLKAFNHIRKASIYSAAGEFKSRYSAERETDLKQILELAFTNVNQARAEWGRKHRRDAWMSVFEKMQFHKWLDTKQRDQFLRDVQRDANIPFTADNIKGTLENVISQRKRLFEQSCANVFDELTSHFYGNTVSEGWKTNDNFKVNHKLVFPYGCRWEDYCGFRVNWERGESALVDMDRCLAILNGEHFEEIQTAYATLDNRFRINGKRVYPGGGLTESSYWEIRYFKKGTVHLKIKDPKMIERFNAASAAGKLWLGMNTNGRDEFPGRGPRYYDQEKRDWVYRQDPPMPPDPDALIAQLRKEYGASEKEITPTPNDPPMLATETQQQEEFDLF